MKNVREIGKVKVRVKEISLGEKNPDDSKDGSSARVLVKSEADSPREFLASEMEDRLSQVSLGTDDGQRRTQQRIERGAQELRTNSFARDSVAKNSSDTRSYSEIAAGSPAKKSDYQLGESLGMGKLRASPTRPLVRAGMPASQQGPLRQGPISRGDGLSSKESYEAAKPKRKKPGPWD